MANETRSEGGRTWRDDIGFDAAADSMRLGTARVLQSAANIGEQLSGHLAEVPLFKVGEETQSRLKLMFEGWSKRITISSIMKLVTHRKRVKSTLQEIPIRMQLVTNQVRLVLELIDDFAEGTYRDIPWHSMAVAAGAILYSVSPADIVPDILPIVGSLDDLFVLGLALKLVEKDLRAYALSKDYDVNDFFPKSDSKVAPQAFKKTRIEGHPITPPEGSGEVKAADASESTPPSESSPKVPSG